MTTSKKGRGERAGPRPPQKEAPCAAQAGPADVDAAIEAETQEIGRELFARLERRSPSIFDRRWWDDRILSWAMADESVKVQMFRFVDVLPMLHSHEAVTRHLQEYFDEVRIAPAAGRPAGAGDFAAELGARARLWRSTPAELAPHVAAVHRRCEG